MAAPVPRSPNLIATAWVLACAAATLAGVALTLAPAEQARAWPWPAALPQLAAAVGPLAAIAAAAALLAMFAAAGHARALGWESLFAGLILVYPLLHAGLWLVLGAGPVAPAAWVTGALLSVALAWLLRRGPRALPPTPPIPARRWLPADLAMVGLPVAAGLLAGAPLDGRAIAFSALTYPLFALLQLTVFLVIPARRLRAMGLGPRGTALACALVFALLHWPQPAVVGLTFVGMLVWALAWQHGRPLWQIALVMGWAATASSQFLPDGWTGHMNVGPRAVRELAIDDLAAGPGPAAADPQRWLAGVYPLAVGRPLLPGEWERWDRDIAREQRARIAWEILLSDEYAALAARGERPAPPPLTEHWSDLPPPWPERIAALAAPDRLREAGGSQAAFLGDLYGELLGRRPAPDQLGTWAWGLVPIQRTALARRLLAHRADLATAPYGAAAFPPLRLPSR